MEEKDCRLWQTCRGVISGSASGDNSVLLPTRLYRIEICCNKLEIESRGGQSSPCSADPVSWERHSFISQLPRLLGAPVVIIFASIGTKNCQNCHQAVWPLKLFYYIWKKCLDLQEIKVGTLGVKVEETNWLLGEIKHLPLNSALAPGGVGLVWVCVAQIWECGKRGLAIVFTG